MLAKSREGDGIAADEPSCDKRHDSIGMTTNF